MTIALHNNPVVWVEISVKDLDKSAAFYGAVLETKLEEMMMGDDRTLVFPSADQGGVSGNLREGNPSPDGGTIIHFNVFGTVEEAAERVKSNGGQVVSPVIDIPVGRFAFCKDIDGNSFGIFTAAAA